MFTPRTRSYQYDDDAIEMDSLTGHSSDVPTSRSPRVLRAPRAPRASSATVVQMEQGLYNQMKAQ